MTNGINTFNYAVFTFKENVMGKPKKDMTGLKVARWTVLNEVRDYRTNSTLAYWNCVCDCGSTKVISGASLRSGKSQSCGCLKREMARDRMSEMRAKESGTIEERFFSRFRVDGATGCWEWTAHRDKDGYGFLPSDKGAIRAHRFSYTLHNGAIPAGLCVCHVCDNPGCVNPEHLWAGTHEDNARDALAKKRHYIGEKNGRAKLTAENVAEIMSSELNGQQLAEKFSVTRGAINMIRRGESWKK